MNQEAPDNSNMDVETSQQAAPAQETQQSAPAQPTVSQEQINKMIESGVQQIPGFSDFQQYQAFLKSQNETNVNNPFEGDLNLSNIDEAAKFTYQKTTAQEEILTRQQQEIEQLKLDKAQRDYESAYDNFTTYWEDKYPNEESMINAINAALPFLPKELQGEYQKAINGEGYLTANFLANLDQAMKNKWIAELDNPESGVLDALLAERAKRKSLQDQSMLSSNAQTSDSGKRTDDFSAEVIYYDN